MGRYNTYIKDPDTGLIIYKDKFNSALDKMNYHSAVTHEFIDLHINKVQNIKGIVTITKYNKNIIGNINSTLELYVIFAKTIMIIGTMMKSILDKIDNDTNTDNKKISNMQKGYYYVDTSLYKLTKSLKSQEYLLIVIKNIVKKIPLEVSKDIQDKKHYVSIMYTVQKINSRITRIKDTLLPELIKEIPLQHYVEYLESIKADEENKNSLLYDDINDSISDLSIDLRNINFEANNDKHKTGFRLTVSFDENIDDYTKEHFNNYIKHITDIVIDRMTNNGESQELIDSYYSKHMEVIAKRVDDRRQEKKEKENIKKQQIKQHKCDIADSLMANKVKLLNQCFAANSVYNATLANTNIKSIDTVIEKAMSFRKIYNSTCKIILLIYTSRIEQSNNQIFFWAYNKHMKDSDYINKNKDITFFNTGEDTRLGVLSKSILNVQLFKNNISYRRILSDNILEKIDNKEMSILEMVLPF